MVLPWKPRGMRKWTLESALNATSTDIIRMKVPERAELANFLQSQLKRRVASYNRAKDYNHPFAYQKLQDDFKELSEIVDYGFDFNQPIIESHGNKHMLSPAYAALDNPNAKLYSYISQLQDFFTSKSSTVKGWREIIRNESMKLFGYREISTKRGPRIYLNHMMTEAERETFWSLYEELKKSGKVVLPPYTSEAMKETGFTRIWREKLKNNEWDFDDLTGMLNKMLAEMKKSGVFVYDIPEHVPGNSTDPTQPDGDGLEDSNVFVW